MGCTSIVLVSARSCSCAVAGASGRPAAANHVAMSLSTGHQRGAPGVHGPGCDRLPARRQGQHRVRRCVAGTLNLLGSTVMCTLESCMLLAISWLKLHMRAAAQRACSCCWLADAPCATISPHSPPSITQAAPSRRRSRLARSSMCCRCLCLSHTHSSTLLLSALPCNPGGTKPATLETGAVINVPLFIESGETIKIDTRTDTYLSRSKE